MRIAGIGLASPAVGEGRFDFLPRHALGQNSQGITQIAHGMEALAKEIGGAVRGRVQRLLVAGCEREKWHRRFIQVSEATGLGHLARQ